MLVQVPVVAVNVWPTCAVPEIVGTVLFAGMILMTAPVGALVAGGLEPPVFAAVTETVSHIPDVGRDGNVARGRRSRYRRSRAVPLIGEGGWIVGPGSGCRRQRLAHLRGAGDRWDSAVRRNDIDDGAGRRARRGRAGASRVRGGDGNRQHIPDVGRDGNVARARRSRYRRSRAVPLIGEGGWIVGPGSGCRRQRLAHLRGAGDRWDSAVRRNDIDDGAGRRARRGRAGASRVRGGDGNRQHIPDVGRDGNVARGRRSRYRRSRVVPLIGEGGWIVGPGSGCRRQRLAHLRGTGDRWDSAVRRNDIDDGAGRRARRGRAGASRVRGGDGNRQHIPDVGRDGNVARGRRSRYRRSRAVPLIGEGGWIVGPGSGCRRQRLAHLRGAGDR